MTALSHSQPIDIDSLHWPVTVLGYGRRVGLWFQGCSIGCPGCCARYTWEPSGLPTNVAEVLSWIESLPQEEIDGFTISGGEPLDQKVALRALLLELRRLPPIDRQRDILVYSGYGERAVLRRLPEIRDSADVLISGPFRVERPSATLRGSDNQKIHRYSDLGWVRYPKGADAAPTALQVVTGEDGIRVIGIPRRGDVERLYGQPIGAGLACGHGKLAGR